jgi:hypothetical protein
MAHRVHIAASKSTYKENKCSLAFVSTSCLASVSACIGSTPISGQIDLESLHSYEGQVSFRELLSSHFSFSKKCYCVVSEPSLTKTWECGLLALWSIGEVPTEFSSGAGETQPPAPFFVAGLSQPFEEF